MKFTRDDLTINHVYKGKGPSKRRLLWMDSPDIPLQQLTYKRIGSNSRIIQQSIEGFIAWAYEDVTHPDDPLAKELLRD